jgi:hypothetical protein
MTDYELLSVFVEFTSNAWAIFATYVSIVFAFIVASYLASRHLMPKVVSLVIALYTLVSFWAVWAINSQVNSISATAAEIKRVVQEDQSSLGWLPVVAVPDFMFPIIPILITSLAIAVYAGSIVFFFYHRKGDSPPES